MRRFLFLLAATLVSPLVWAANDPFTGEWKVDTAKSHLTDQMKVESLGGNKYAFDFGAGPETIFTDGTDQPGYAGTTLAVTAKAPDAWNVVRKKDGKRMLSADWQLSKDGQSLVDRFTAFGPDGAGTEVDYLYTRTAGTAGFAGTWESASVTMDQAFVIKVKPYGKDGLSFDYPSTGKIKDMKFDGKDTVPTGPSMLDGTTFSALRPGPGEIDVTDKLKGVVVDTQQLVLSADHKTLTMTIRTPGKRLPSVLVLQRQ